MSGEPRGGGRGGMGDERKQGRIEGDTRNVVVEISRISRIPLDSEDEDRLLLAQETRPLQTAGYTNDLNEWIIVLSLPTVLSRVNIRFLT